MRPPAPSTGRETPPSAPRGTEAAPRRRVLAMAVPALAWRMAPLLSILLLAVAWEAMARSGAVTPFVLPPLSSVLARIWQDAAAGDLWINTGVTVYRAMVGFFIAAAGGILLGLAMTRSAGINWFFDPIVSVGFPMPKIAFLPVVILWLGLYDTAKITMVAIDAIFPVVTATVIAVRGVDRELLWSARNMGAKEGELLRQVVLPAALPQIFTGLQVALPIALIVAIVAEMAMGGYGLGGGMLVASRFADSRGVFAGIVEIAAVGFVLVKGMALIRRRLLLWHQEALEPSTA